MGTYLSTPKLDKETESGSGLDVVFGMAGMQGWRRTMEDAHIAAVKLGQHDDIALFGVFDGHGGAEVANFCAKHLADEVLAIAKFQAHDYEGALKDVFHRMDTLLKDGSYANEIALLKERDPNEGEGDEKGEGGEDMAMWQRIVQLKRLVIEKEGEGEGGAVAQVQAGCTAIVALKHKKTLYVANAGDSRGVLCRAGQAVALSEDHKPAHSTEKNRIMAAGGFVSDIGGVARVNGNLNLSRAIGDLKYKMNDELPVEAQIITAHPDVRVFELTPDDRYMILACDGIWDVLNNQQAVDFATAGLDAGQLPHEVSAAMLDRCLARDPKEAYGIGCDNMTCMIVTFNDYSAAVAASAAK